MEKQYHQKHSKPVFLVLTAGQKYFSSLGQLSRKSRQYKMVEKEKEKEQSIEQLQLVEQNLQSLLLQKQVFQVELIETNNALEGIKKTKAGEDIFKIIGSLMIKSKKAELEKELEQKRDLLNLRLKAIESQEKDLGDKLINIRKEVLKTYKQK